MMVKNIPIMKSLHLFNFIKIRLATILILVFSIIFGNIKQVLLLFLIAIIHELFHLLACKILKVKVLELNILPFGAYLKVNDVENLSSYKQIIIYIAGPLSIIFNLLWINIFYNLAFLNKINYDFLLQINLAMCLVNLLPIYPLDGYMIIKAILQKFFPYKKALKIANIISLISFIIFIFYNFISLQIMLTIFLLIEQIKNLLQRKNLYQKFLIYKSKLIKHKKFKVIPNYLMFKDVNNYKIEKNKILNDQDIAILELQKTNYN